ncbi:recombinase family protein [Paracoccus suum]|uniref:Recombinase family protein n=1 Tax=Paracoccus suum TaxID=2259340 RepID=A0A344PNU8_9RHOB|nr:recombinase family protein [Paracoccus suum]AXC51053.1 recombinase family protein [Paracoccus suum]
MTRAVIYARYSTDLQRKASIEDQARLCQERANHEGWTLTEVFSDMAISGATMLRPGLQALLDRASRGKFAIVLAEALDRLSRDQADIATLYKQLSFNGVRIITLAEGEISELHVGLKGTMNQLFLKDLADKTRRGLRGRVETGRSGGGNSFGYDVVRRIGKDGEPVTGERTINIDEAEIIRRVFREFADGRSPKAIARRLNADGVPGPRGALWRDTAIRGHRIRGTGLLNNELYIGRLVWNRLRYMKDPATGRRVSRLNPVDALIITDVPEMRLVEQELWERVKTRQGEIDNEPRIIAIKATRFWERKRQIHLLTGLLRCGCCGGGFAAVGRDYVACSASRKLGTCKQRVSIRRTVLEEAVLSLLRNRLMQPEAVAMFIKAVAQETNVRNGTASADRAKQLSERTMTARKLEGLYDAIAEGLRTPGLKSKLEELEGKLVAIDAALAAPAPSPLRLHPNLSELYRCKVAELATTLADPEIRPQALETIRSLIEAVTVQMTPAGITLVLYGALSAMVGLAQGGTAKSPLGSGLDDRSVEVVAGTGFEPVTFRL